MGDGPIKADILLSVLQPVFVNEVWSALPLRPDEPNDLRKRKPALLPREFRQLAGGRLFEHWQERHADAKSFLTPAIEGIQFRSIALCVVGILAAQLFF